MKENFTLLEKNANNIFYGEAKESEIESLQENIGYKLPSSYKDFLMVTNGALLFQTDEFFGTKDSEETLQKSIETVMKNTHDLPKGLIPFCKSGYLYCFEYEEVGSPNYKVISWNSRNNKKLYSGDNFENWFEDYIADYM